MRIAYLLIILFSSIGYTQVSQFPQVYYNGQGSGGSNLDIRVDPSLSSSIITTLSPTSKIGAESYTTSSEANGTASWAKVCLPSTTGNITYGYMMYGEFNIRINEVNNYATVTASSLFIRPCAGCTTSNVTINGQNALYGQNSIVVLTGVKSNVSDTTWYEVFLTTNCSQEKGWLSGSFLNINDYTTNYYVIAGKVKNNNQQPVWGATISITGETTSTTEGYYQYKKEKNSYTLITCNYNTYSISLPNNHLFTIYSHRYNENFILMNLSAPCSQTNYFFNNQAEVDAFPSLNIGCNQIIGNVTIQGQQIVNLDSLHQIELIGDDLILYNIDNLTNLVGFEKLGILGGNLQIDNNNNLLSLDGLENLESVYGTFFLLNNTNLSNLNSLQNLDSIIGDFQIDNNDNLINLYGLESLVKIHESLQISSNNDLQNLNGLNNLEITGGLGINSNNNLNNLNALSSLYNVTGNLSIGSNSNFTNLEGLENINTIGGYISLIYTTLTNLNGLENVNLIGNKLYFWGNNNLQNISALNNAFIAGGGEDELTIVNNPLLSECQIESICQYLSFHSGNINNNAIGCNDEAEVELNCPIYCTPISIINQPQDLPLQENESGQTSCNTTGTSISFQWQLSIDNGNTWGNISNNGIYEGVSTNTLSINNASITMNGYKFRCSLINDCTPQVFSETSALTVNSNCTPISSNYTIEDRYVIEPSATNFGLTISGTEITYIWEFSTNNGNTWIPVPNSSPYVGVGTSSLTIVPTSVSMNGNKIRCNVSNDCTDPQYTNVATLSVSTNCIPVNINVHPQDLSVEEGEQDLFLVQAGGTQPINVQWYKNNQPIQGATNFQYEIPPALLSDNGSAYKAILSNCAGNSTAESNSAILNVSGSCNQVSVISGPYSTNVQEGGTANFQIIVEGDVPILYQWYFNNQGISAPNSNIYTISNVNQSNSGTYYCEVRNCLVNGIYTGNDGSQVATLTVTQGCNSVGIQTQPIDKPAVVGGTATFSVTPNGTGPYTFQWKKNGVNIQTGGNSNEYTTPVLSLSDNGNKYSCYITNCQGQYNKTSNEATLTVTQNCNTPTEQAKNIIASNITHNKMTLIWTNGNGSRRIIKINKTNNFINPSNNTDPVGNSLYSGNGEQVIYNGSGNSVTVTGLAANTNYWFRIYEAGCSGNTSKYNVSTESNNPKANKTDILQTGNVSVIGDLNFGAVTVNDVGEKIIQLKNNSNSPITFQNISFNPSGSFNTILSGSDIILPGKSKYFSILFFPTQLISYNSTITFTTNAPNNSISINASGIGQTNPLSWVGVYNQLENNPEIKTRKTLNEYFISSQAVNPIKICADGSKSTIVKFINKNTNIATSKIIFRIKSDPFGNNSSYTGWFLATDYYLVGNTVEAKFIHPKYLNILGLYRNDAIEIWNTEKGELIHEIPIEIYRAPILLVHGLWGDITSMDIIAQKLVNSGKYIYSLIKLSDYKNTNDQSFLTNSNIIKNDINSKLMDLRFNNFSAGKVDIIAHSMGGILARNYLQNNFCTNTITKNCYRGDINKLITLNTPHSGTQIANFLLSQSSGAQLARDILDLSEMYWNSGAVSDLKCNSSAIQNLNGVFLNNHIVPCHSFQTTKDPQLNINMIEFNEEELTFLVARKRLQSSTYFNNQIFDYSPNDLIVPTNSQRGGLSDFSFVENIVHTNSPKNLFVINKVKELLDANPLTSSYFDQNITGFHPPIITPTTFKQSAEKDIYRISQIELNITEPANNQIFNSGDSILIKLEASENATLIMSISNEVSGSSFFEIDSNFASINYKIPENYGGFINVIAIAFDEGGNYAFDTLKIYAQPIYSIDSINFIHEEINIPIGQLSHFTLLGYYDSLTINLNEFGNIPFILGDSTICEFGLNHTIKALSLGSTYLKGSYQGLDAYVVVNVYQGDNWINKSNAIISKENICISDTIKFTANTNGYPISYFWSFQGGNPNTSSDSIATVVFDSSGIFDVILITEFDDKNDTLFLSEIIKVNNPISTISKNTTDPICNGDTLLLTSNLFNSYKWSTLDTTHSIIVKESGDYYVMVTDSNGCSTISDTLSVLVHDLPNATISANGLLAFCDGDSITLTVPEANSYLWNTEDSTQQIIVKTEDDYSVTIIDTFGCSAISDTIQVIVHDLPEVLITPSDVTTFCFGDSVTLLSIDAESYLWNTNDTTQSIIVKSYGEYSLSVIDSNGCSSTSLPISIVVNELPKPIISSLDPTNFCEGDSITLTTIESESYLWSSGDTTKNIIVHASGNFIVSVIDSNGCQGISDTLNVIESDNPIANIYTSRSPILCQGDSVILSADNAESYLWSNGATSKSITVNNEEDFRVTVTNSMGCVTVSNSINVKVNPLPVVTIYHDDDTQLCIGESLLLTSSEAISYKWSTGDITKNLNVVDSGEYLVTITDAIGCKNVSNPISVIVFELPIAEISFQGDPVFCDGDSITLLSNEAMSYNWNNNVYSQSNTIYSGGNYFVTITDLNGCSAVSDTINITVNSLPEVNINSSKGVSICYGDSTILSVNEASNYIWSTGDTTKEIIVIDSGYYSVKVIDSNGCSNVSDQTNIMIYDLPQAVISSNNSPTFCEGSSITLISTEANTYLWSNGESSKDIMIDSSGDFKVTVTDINGCSNVSNLITATVLPLLTPKVDITSTKNLICDGELVSFIANPINGGTSPTYQWFVNGILQSESSSTLNSNSLNNGANIICVMTSNEQCVTIPTDISNSIIMAVNPLLIPEVSISTASSTINACEEVTFTATTINGGITPKYKWYVNGFLVSTQQEFTSINLTNGSNIYCSLNSSALCATEEIVYSDTISMSVLPLSQPILEISNDTIYSSNYNKETYLYTWYKDSEQVSTNPFILCNEFGAGSYYLVVVINECTITSSTIDIVCNVATGDYEAENKISVFPNPTFDKLNIIGENIFGNQLTIEVFNVFGQKLDNHNVSINNFRVNQIISLDKYYSGIYYLNIYSESAKRLIKVIKMD